MIQTIALIAAVILPFWNVPLIIRIVRRGSSGDISVVWAIGVWVCLVLMAPSGFTSKDPVWKAFNIVNFVLFTLVVIFVLSYRKGRR
ncbi:MAG: hypothetical protein HY589_03630 [Candidatus Omnitrophica bacterium]|nr:hypothetical protein [Candidatus Omnitrophota bacterium]